MNEYIYQIINVKPLPEYKLQLAYSNGKIIIADLEALIKSPNNAFNELRDPEIFKQVSISKFPDTGNPNGSFIVWLDKIDLSAEGLWFNHNPKPPVISN